LYQPVAISTPYTGKPIYGPPVDLKNAFSALANLLPIELLAKGSYSCGPQ